jgi:hypothetical protein
MFMLDNRSLPLDIGFTHNGIQYPNNWLRLASSKDRSAIGITEVADPEPYDDRFYWGLDNPKDLDGLKAYWVSQFKDTAGQLLAQTDWMIVRKMERSIDVPDETATYRASVVAECARLETAITSATDVAALIVVVGSQNWGEESVF